MPNTFTLIASSTVGAGGASSITFSSIPSTYTDLCLKISARDASFANEWKALRFAFNGSSDYTTNWTMKGLYGTGSATGTESYSTSSFSFASSANATANTFSNTEIYIPNYYVSGVKSISADSVTENNATRSLTYLSAALYNSSIQISSITFKLESDNNFAQYSTAYLYGVKNA